MGDISGHERMRVLAAVVIGALGATTFMISAILPEMWYRTAMVTGAAVAIAAFAVVVALSVRQ